MPIYQIRNKQTEETWEEFCSYSALQELLKDNPDYVQVLGSPGFIAGHGQKPDEGFRDILRSIKQRNSRSNINTF